MTHAEPLRIGVAADRSERILQRLLDFIRERGGAYHEDGVTQIEHALQCADLARASDLGDAAVAAALLHDVGHLLLAEHRAVTDMAPVDLRHEEIGANFLRGWFEREVTEPVRLHVRAKRYLCTVDPSYLHALSPASRRSFELQGGILHSRDCEALERSRWFHAALALRGLDDRANVPGRVVPDIDTFLPALRRVLRASYAAAGAVLAG